MQTIYVGLGGNIGDVHRTFCAALQLIEEIPGVWELGVSSFYRTTPVSPIPQSDYLNAVCRFKTSLSADVLFHHLQRIQRSLGQGFKTQDAPRLIDLDLLFYGWEKIQTPHLQVPHPRWRERLFVLVPLADVAEEVIVEGEKIVLAEEIGRFYNQDGEIVQEEYLYAHAVHSY